MEHSAFIPQGADRRATARLLVTTADAHGIDQSSIQSARGGFRVTEELADVLYDGHDTNHASGNRAAKRTTEQEQ